MPSPGLTRFDEFQKSLGIAPNMLTRRLNALVERRAAGAPPLQRAAAARRISADRARRAISRRCCWPCWPGATGISPRKARPSRSSTAGPASRPTRCWSTAPQAAPSQRPTMCWRRAGRDRSHPPPAGARQRRARAGSTPVAHDRRSACAAVTPLPRPPAGRRADRDEPAHPAPAARADPADAAAGMAWPNILVMLAQASTGLIETWWVVPPRHRRAGRHGAGVPRLHDDADAVGRAPWAAASRRPSPVRWAAAGGTMPTRWCCTR